MQGILVLSVLSQAELASSEHLVHQGLKKAFCFVSPGGDYLSAVGPALCLAPLLSSQSLRARTSVQGLFPRTY